MLESQRLEGDIACPAIRFEDGTRCYHIDNEAGQAGSRNSGDMAQTNSSEPLLSHFYRDGYDRLGDRVPTMTTGPQSPKIAFIHLHRVNQSVSTRPHHGPPEFVKPCLSGDLTAQAKDSWQSEGVGPVFLAYQFPCGMKPKTKRLPCTLKNCSRGHRDLATAQGAQKQVLVGTPSRWAAWPAHRAHKLFEPPQLLQITLASLFIGGKSKKSLQCSRKIDATLWPKRFLYSHAISGASSGTT